ncbi:MAG: VWA domain-containing protein, partial [Dolichospermum sp.]
SSDPNHYGTDIQKAELTIYQGIAQINQNRLMKNQPIKPQSVVWVTDAPLGTKPGITSEIWIETPGDSPFRIAESPPSQERQKWIETLPLKERSRTIKNQDNKDYKLSVVDINPTVQEFCTPAPG